MKHVLRNAMQKHLPKAVSERKDKMGFPVPLNSWIQNEAKDFIYDIFSSQSALNRDLINNKVVLDKLNQEPKFGRKVWGLLCLELWQQEFHDRSSYYREFVTLEKV
jgi:asparagine synthase (glutamine-hydrolysing)